MATGIRPRVKLPRTVRAGQSITIKTLISHPMDNGHSRDGDGRLIPKWIINRFTCDFNGRNVVDFALGPSIATNPFLEFDAIVSEAGTFTFTWHDDDGSVYEHSQTVAIG